MAEKLRILATAKQRGSVDVMAPVARELMQRGHYVDICATGNPNEAAGFGDLPYHGILSEKPDYLSLVKGFDRVIVGLTDYKTSDGYFLRAANASRIKTVAIQDRDDDYTRRLGNNPEDFPTLFAALDYECLETMITELGKEIGEKLASKTKVVGHIALDGDAKLKTEFNKEKRKELLRSLGLDPEQKIYLHFTQNIHPYSEYMKPVTWTPEQKQQNFEYELGLTETVFKIAADMGLRLVVKPHTGERFRINYTEDLVKFFGFNYVPAKACDTNELILSADSVSAGKSTALTHACLLDRNTGSFLPKNPDADFPDLSYDKICVLPPIKLEAIPYTQNWNEIKNVLSLITSSDETTNKNLEKLRKRFSVDGKSAKRLVDLIESL